MVSTAKKIKKLNSKFSLFSNPDTEEGAKIASFGKFHLVRLNLHQRYHYQHFLDSAYDACLAKIEQGESIEFLAAFVKRTMYNQMHVELRKLKKATYSLCYETLLQNLLSSSEDITEETLPQNLLSSSEDVSLNCQLALKAHQNVLLIDPPNALPQIYTGKDISLKKLAGFMGITHQEMANIIDKDLRTVQRDTASTKVAQKLNPVIYTLKMLWELTGEDLVAVQRWLREPLVEWRGLTPLSCLVEHKFDAVVQLVERIHFGDSAGY